MAAIVDLLDQECQQVSAGRFSPCGHSGNQSTWGIEGQIEDLRTMAGRIVQLVLLMQRMCGTACMAFKRT